MRKLRKFFGLSSSDRSLLIKSLATLYIVRIGLLLLSFKTLWNLLSIITFDKDDDQSVNQAFIDKVVWAVTVTSRYVPGASCLAQALATYMFLRPRVPETNIQIGVLRSDSGEFKAHAWVECQGVVVIGGVKYLPEFNPILCLRRD